MPRRRLDAEPVVAQINLIEIRFKDLVLGIVLFHLARGALLAKLARQTEIAAVDDIGVHIPDELLRNRARAAPPSLAEKLPLDGTGDADQIDAVVLIEALILDGDKRVREISGKGPQSDARAELASNLSDQRSISRENERRLRLRRDLPRLAFGRSRLVDARGILRLREAGEERELCRGRDGDETVATAIHASSSTLNSQQRYN